MNDDPLRQLIVDSEELDKEKLASLILGNLGISKNGDAVILPGFTELTTKSKILSFLLAKKAAKVMSLSTDDSASMKEVSQKTGLPEGTVGRELSELKQIRLVSSEQGYFVPDYAIHLITIEKRTEEKKSQHIKSTPRKAAKKISNEGIKTERSNKIDLLLKINLESIKPELIDLMLKPGSYLERSLAVLKVARDNGIDDLTPAEIEAFLKDKIRAGATWKSNISLNLGKKGTRYVDRYRDPSGNGFTYRIMIPGEQLLEETLKKSTMDATPVEDGKTDNEEKTE
ncbi:MAG: hypothetical protein Q8P80_03315 [Candidatus Levybacteria bacterium]|nr:hypothetical protein [Candidatus Levybacteria bacterium]